MAKKQRMVEWMGEEISFEELKEQAIAASKRWGNPTELNRLSRFAALPHSMEDEDFLSIISPIPRLGRKKWLNEMSQLPLIYASVVQADDDLYYPNDLPHRTAILVFAEDKEHHRDLDWLQVMTAVIQAEKRNKRVPSDAQKLISILKDNRSFYSLELPDTLSFGAKAWVSVYRFHDREMLPNHFLPEDGYIPFFLKCPKFAWSDGLIPIPPEYYMTGSKF